MPIQFFDESRLAVNAVEMAENGDFIVTYFEGEPDMWNTKPPLMIWLQVLCLKIFGFNELAIRMPAALAALIITLFIGFFCWNKMGRPIWGVVASGVLITTPGFINKHVSRTGDYDALLILFLVLFIHAFFQFVHAETKKEKRQKLYLSSLFLALAVLSKSIAGLFFVPAAVIYLFLKKEGLKTLKSKDTYFAFMMFLVLVFGYYFLREHYNPGYLQAVWENEIGGRYFDVLENHGKPFYFHFKYLWKTRFVPWIYLLPIGLVIGFYEEGKVKNYFQLLFITAISFLLVISFSSTKLMWYDAPLFPILAIITALGIERTGHLLNQKYHINQWALIGLLIALPYYNIVRKVYYDRNVKSKHHLYGLFMRELADYKEYSIIKTGNNAPILFYQQAYKRKGYKIKKVKQDEIKVGEVAVLCEKEPIKILKEQFEYKLIKDSWGCMLVEVLKRKE